MRVLVCGGRDYADREHVDNTLSKIDAERGPISCVIHGAARGADTLGMGWGKALAQTGRPIKQRPFPADWDRDGRAVGPLRNARMLADGKPDLVVAFPGGRGTADMATRARKAGVEVIEIPARDNRT